MGGELNDAGALDPAAVRARMLELTRKFLVRTTEDLAQMRAALARLDEVHDSGNGRGLEVIRQLAHRACGTSGTLGLHALSDAAGELELLIDALPGGTTGTADRERVAAGIEAIAARLVPL